MSWPTDRTTIVSGLPSGYQEIPENIEPDDENRPATFNNKCYSLKLSGITDIQFLSSNIMLYSHLVEMKVIYATADETILITGEGLLMTLIQTLSGISGFHNFSEDVSVDMLDNKHIVCTIRFHFGEDDNE